MALNPREERFAQEYAVEPNGKKAATTAGYAPGSAHVTASRLLRKPNVAARIAELHAKTARRLEITAEQIARRAWEIAGQDKPDRVAALSLLAKQHPEFNEKREVEHKGSVTIQRNTRALRD